MQASVVSEHALCSSSMTLSSAIRSGGGREREQGLDEGTST
jgi:hypothetical protein